MNLDPTGAAPAPGAPPRRHAVLALLAVLSVVTYLDRICISVAGPYVQEELELTPEEWSWVLNAFIISYGLFEIPSGALGDRLGHARVLTRIVVWWSAFTALTGLAWNYAVLVVTRFLFGAGEAGAYPNITGVIGRWFPAGERARAQGIVWAASRVGGALSPLLVVPLLRAVGWHGTFFLFGALGFAWAVVWSRGYRALARSLPAEPARAGGTEAAGGGRTEGADATRGGGAENKRGCAPLAGVPWRILFRSRQLWLIMLMYWCYVWGSIFYLGWFPTYLVKGRGLSLEEMSLFAALPFVLGALGNAVGGRLGDRLVRRYGLSLGRRLMGTTCLLLSAALLAATALTTGKMTGVVLLALGFGVMDCMLPSAWSLCVDVGGRHSGAVSGAMNTAGSAGGFACTWLFGQLVGAVGDYSNPMFFIAGMVSFAACLFWLIDPTKPIFPPAGPDGPTAPPPTPAPAAA
jgi:ACS family glucarate transporter-like MFS transporter